MAVKTERSGTGHSNIYIRIELKNPEINSCIYDPRMTGLVNGVKNHLFFSKYGLFAAL